MKKSKSLPQLKIICQDFCNKYIRLRDHGKPCISCGEVKPNMQAGHYFAVGGYDGIRYDEDNIHLECQYDNCFNESHLIGYGDNLIERIGKDRFEALKLKAAEYKKNGYKFSRSEILEKIKYFKEKIKELNS